MPAAKAERTSPQVHGHVENLTRNYPNQFALRASDLIVQTAHDISGRKGMIVLHKILRNANLGHAFLIETFEKESSSVPKNSRLD